MNGSRCPAALALALALASAFVGGCATPPEQTPSAPAPPPGPWIELLGAERSSELGFAGWEAVPFGGEAEVVAEADGLRFGYGLGLTGVRWAAPLLPDGAPLPVDDYELEVVAARLGGTDFFCGLSFPVSEGALSLILGGWGGSLVGLSCLDGADASANETTRYLRFEQGRPYAARVRVSGGRVVVWLDGQPLYDLEVAGRRLELRAEIAAGGPLGVASFQTAAAVRAVRIRRLPSR